jgi:hypothetical protein
MFKTVKRWGVFIFECIEACKGRSLFLTKWSDVETVKGKSLFIFECIEACKEEEPIF